MKNFLPKAFILPKFGFKKLMLFTLLSLLVFLLVLFLLVSLYVWRMASDAVQPPRRGIQDYHQLILNNPKKEGVNITSIDCHQGQTPCLIISAHPTVTEDQLGERAKILRRQVTQDFHYSLEPFVKTAKNPQGIVVLIHGKNGRKEDLLPVAIRLSSVGYITAVIDLPAHGENPMSTCKVGTELVEQRTENQTDLVNQTLSDIQAWATKTYGEQLHQSAEELPTFLWGLSMGGSYAVHAIAEQPDNWDGVIIVASFDSLQKIGEYRVNRILEDKPKLLQGTAKFLLFNLFDVFAVWQGGVKPENVQPAQVAKGLDLPVLMIHGELDDAILPERGRVLFDSFGSDDKTWVSVAEGTHDNILVTRAPVYASMASWLLEHSQTPAKSVLQ